jgi:hypothetical protein
MRPYAEWCELALLRAVTAFDQGIQEGLEISALQDVLFSLARNSALAAGQMLDSTPRH